MIELLAFVFVIVIVVVAVRIGRQDDSQTFTDRTTSTTSKSAGCISDGMVLERQHAEQIGDTEAVQAIDNGTYKELLERRAAARQNTIQQDYASYQYDIAGINFRRGIADYLGQSTGYLKPQQTNRHDPNAIAIYASDGHHIGYIREYETDEVRALRLRFPIPVSVDIEECYDSNEERRFFVGSVTIIVKRKDTKI